MGERLIEEVGEISKGVGDSVIGVGVGIEVNWGILGLIRLLMR